MNEKINIKDWKLKEIARDNNGGFLEEILGVQRETEKAMLLLVEWAYTSSCSKRISIWVPKSATMTDEEAWGEREAAVNRFNDGCARYEELLKWAKEHGVKGVRSGMKTSTIMSKISSAGLTYC